MDWKEALKQLGAREPEQESVEESRTGGKKRKSGMVYSTNPHYVFEDDTPAEPDTLPLRQQKLHIQMERAGRAGKTVTLVRGFVGKEADLKQLAVTLKRHLGVGGSVKDGEIIIQGDHRARLQQLLKDMQAKG